MFHYFWLACDGISDAVFALDLVVQLRTGYLEQGLMVQYIHTYISGVALIICKGKLEVIMAQYQSSKSAKGLLWPLILFQAPGI